MSTIWSNEIQSSEILYYSRACRFNDFNKDKWFNFLHLKENLNILELGCGPGHFTNMIKKHFPSCNVTGVDLDENHIKFANNMAKTLNLDVTYLVGDANNLPFENNQFDLIFSHTLVEHLPFEEFVTEQKRLLKDNGLMIFITVDSKRKHVNTFDYMENELDEIYNSLQYKDNNITVGQYNQTPQQYLQSLRNLNFKTPSARFEEVVYYFPDITYNTEEGLKQIEMLENSDIYNAKFNLSLSTNGQQYETQLIQEIKNKYAERKKLYIENSPVYDYESTALNIFYAYK